MSHQGKEGWYPECKYCGCGNLSDVYCEDCVKEKLKQREEEIIREIDSIKLDKTCIPNRKRKKTLKEFKQDIIDKLI